MQIGQGTDIYMASGRRSCQPRVAVMAASTAARLEAVPVDQLEERPGVVLAGADDVRQVSAGARREDDDGDLGERRIFRRRGSPPSAAAQVHHDERGPPQDDRHVVQTRDAATQTLCWQLHRPSDWAASASPVHPRDRLTQGVLRVRTGVGDTRAPGLRMGARLTFLDAARGLAVVAMLLANLVNVFAPVRPRWLGHNLGDELQLFDLPAPVFQLLIGTSLVLFLMRHAHAGAPEAVRRLAIRRFVMLIGLGGLLDAIAAGHLEVRWGVLQTLGMGGLVAVVFASTSDALALGVAALILATHYGPGNNEVHRSAVDCLPFLSLTLLGLVIGRPLASGDRARFRRRALFAATGCLMLAVGLRLAGIPFNKVTGTSSFVALAGSVGATLLVALESFDAGGLAVPRSLALLGANALTAWVLQYVLVFYPFTYAVAPPDVSVAANLGMVVLAAASLMAVTLALGRRGIRIPI